MRINQALKILEDHNLPSNIVKHTLKVARVCSFMADYYPGINRSNLICAAILHDLFKLTSNNHSEEIFDFLNNLLEPELAQIARKHDFDAIIDPTQQPFSLEEKILSYADKRVKHDQIAPLQDRFSDFKLRYNPNNEDPKWVKDAQKAHLELEEELFAPLDIEPSDIKEENLKDL